MAHFPCTLLVYPKCCFITYKVQSSSSLLHFPSFSLQKVEGSCFGPTSSKPMLSLNTNQEIRKLTKFGYVSSAYFSSGTSIKSKTI